jgi:hypothetical protein
MSKKEEINSKISLLKEDIRLIYHFEIIHKRFNIEKTDLIISQFDQIVSRNCYFQIDDNPNDTVTEISRKRKIINIFKFLENGDWSEPTLLKLIEAILIRIFTTTKSLTFFSQNLKELRDLSKQLYLDEIESSTKA